MPSTFKQYIMANYIICFGVTIIILIVDVFILLLCPNVFDYIIDKMFSIEITDDGTLKFYNHEIKLPPREGCLQKSPWRLKKYGKWHIDFALVIMITAVLSATFVVFFDQMILIIVFVDQNGKCPIDGDMDCFATYSNSTYFFCNSTDTRIDPGLGLAACYRWFTTDISTLNVLNQIGVCTGFIQAASWCVEIFMRLNLSIFKRAKTDSESENKICSCTSFLRKFKHPYLYVPWVILFPLIFLAGAAALPISGVLKLSLKGSTFAVLLASLVVSMVLFIWLVIENDIKDSPKDENVISPVAIQGDHMSSKNA